MTLLSTYSVGGPSSAGPVLDLHIGNVNGDGYADMVKMQSDFIGQKTTVQLLMGDGAGGFTPNGGTAFPWTVSGSYPQFMAIGDLNGDSIDDVVAASSSEVGKTYLLTSVTNGAGYTNHTTTIIAHSNTSLWVGMANMNTDAYLDLVIATDSEVIVKLGDGTGTNFTNVIVPWAPDANRDAFLDIGDLDGNGSPDLVMEGAYFLNSNGVFGAEQNYNTGITGENAASDLKLCDVDGDSDLDLVLTSLYELHVFLGDGAGNFADNPPLVHPIGTSGGANHIAAHDFDGNGITDIIAGDYELDYYVYFRAGTANPKIIWVDSDTIDFTGATSIDIGDIDDDGSPEVVVGDDFANEIFLYSIGEPFSE